MTKPLDGEPGPPDFATALSRPGEGQTTVLGHARGENVLPLLDLARNHDIPVLQDFALSSALRGMPPGSQIPDDVFQAVGTVLDFLLEQDRILEEEFQQQADRGEPGPHGQ